MDNARHRAKDGSSLAKLGLRLGALTGGILAASYATLVILGMAIYAIATADPSSQASLTFTVLTLMFISGIMAAIAGVLPATILAMLAGAIIGAVLARLQQALSTTTSALAGVVVCLLLAIPVHLLVRSAVPTLAGGTGYWLWLGVPSLIYLAIGGWVGRRLYREVTMPMVQPAHE